MAALIDAPVLGSYPDPRVLRLSGMERMDLIHEGRSPRPPTHYLCGHVPTDWSPGRASFAMPPSPWFQMTRGIVSPGIVALPADAALGTAFATTVPAGVVTTTSELTVNYLRPIRMRRLAARASVIDATPHQGLIESGVFDEDGRLVAHLTSRYVTLRPDVDPALLEGEIPMADDPPSEQGLHETPLPDDEVGEPFEGSGIEGIERASRGELPTPPLIRFLNMAPPTVAEGRFATTIPASRWFTSPARTIYGGLTALVLEVVSTGAVTTTLPAGWSVAPLDMKVQYLRPWLADERPCALEAEVIHRGRTLAVTRAELRNADGKPLALATGSALVLNRPWRELSSIGSLPAVEERG